MNNLPHKKITFGVHRAYMFLPVYVLYYFGIFMLRISCFPPKGGWRSSSLELSSSGLQQKLLSYHVGQYFFLVIYNKRYLSKALCAENYVSQLYPLFFVSFLRVTLLYLQRPKDYPKKLFFPKFKLLEHVCHMKAKIKF